MHEVTLVPEPSWSIWSLGVSGLKEKSAHVPHGTEVHALDSSWPPTHACPAAVTQYPCASVASKSCMTWHDLIAVMTSALWLLVLHLQFVHSMHIGMSAVVSISGPPLDLQYSTVAVPGQLSEKEKKAVAKMDKKMGTAEEEPDPEEPHDDDDDEDEAPPRRASPNAKAKAKSKAKAKAKPVAKAKKASTMKKPAKALQKKPSQK